MAITSSKELIKPISKSMEVYSLRCRAVECFSRPKDGGEFKDALINSHHGLLVNWGDWARKAFRPK